jgi:hypothetical protein
MGLMTMQDKPPLSFSSAPRVPKTLREAAKSFFAFGSPRLLGAQLACAAILRPFFGEPTIADALVLAGVMAYWPVQEWVLHRFLLHARKLRVSFFDASRHVEFQTAAARAHQKHHDSPLDPKLTLLPTMTIALLIPVHIVLWKLIAPSRGIACTGVMCLGAAALSYEWIHFLTHTAYRPKTAWFAKVKKRHLAHHFRDSTRWFAFAVPAVDEWLGTGDRDGDRARTNRSSTPS